MFITLTHPHCEKSGPFPEGFLGPWLLKGGGTNSPPHLPQHLNLRVGSLWMIASGLDQAVPGPGNKLSERMGSKNMG
jgi:hypothetical protein